MPYGPNDLVVSPGRRAGVPGQDYGYGPNDVMISPSPSFSPSPSPGGNWWEADPLVFNSPGTTASPVPVSAAGNGQLAQQVEAAGLGVPFEGQQRRLAGEIEAAGLGVPLDGQQAGQGMVPPMVPAAGVPAADPYAHLRQMDTRDPNELLRLMGEAYDRQAPPPPPSPMEFVQDPDRSYQEKLDYVLSLGQDDRTPGQRLADEVDRFREREPDSTFYWMERVPFLGGALTTADNVQALISANRIKEGEAGDVDFLRVGRYLANEEWKNDRSFGGKVFDVVTQIPGFAAEFLLTGGTFSAGRVAGQKLAQKGLGELTETAVGKLARQAVGGAVGVAAQTVANPQHIAANATERMIPEFGLERDRQDQLQLTLLDPGDGFLEALPKGFLDTFIELGSERLGGQLATGAGKVLEFVPGASRLTALKTGVVNRWFRNNPGSKIGDLLDEVRQRAGWHGILGEVAEERAGEVARGLTGSFLDEGFGVTGQLATGDFGPALEQLAVEGLAFSVPGLAQGAISQVGDRGLSIPPSRQTTAETAVEPASALPYPKDYLLSPEGVAAFAVEHPEGAARFSLLDRPSRRDVADLLGLDVNDPTFQEEKWSSTDRSGLAETFRRLRFLDPFREQFAPRPTRQPQAPQVPEPQIPGPTTLGPTVPSPTISEPTPIPEAPTIPLEPIPQPTVPPPGGGPAIPPTGTNIPPGPTIPSPSGAPELTYIDAVRIAKQLGIKSNGNKADLIRRVTEALQGPQTPQPGPTAGDIPPAIPEPPQPAPTVPPTTVPDAPTIPQQTPAPPQFLDVPKPSLPGQETTIVSPGIEQPIPARYAVFDLSDLVASHSFMTGQPSSNVSVGLYPEGLQPRDYGTGTSEAAKVSRIAGSQFDPRFLVSQAPSSDMGPPTVTPSGVVINGNGRVMSLQLLNRRGAFPKYQKELMRQAESFGLTPESLEGVKNPVLVRVVDVDPTSPQAVQFARSGNVSTTESQSPARTAESLRGLIDLDLLDSIHLDEDTTFSESVTSSTGGRKFRESVQQALPQSQRAQFFNNDGTLTEGGVELVRNMLLTRVLPIETVERLGADKKALKRTIEGAIPQLLKLTRDYAAGDVTPQLNEALGFLIRNPDVRNRGQADDTLAQGSLFGGRVETLSPGGRMMLDFLLEDGQRPKVFRRKLSAFLRDLSQGTGLFADELPPIPVMASETLGVPQRAGAVFGRQGSAAEPAEAETEPEIQQAAPRRPHQPNTKHMQSKRRGRMVRVFEGDGEWFQKREEGKNFVVLVDTAKLDRIWAMDRQNYIPPGGGGAEISGRIKNFLAWRKRNPKEPVIMPQVFAEAKRGELRVRFEDGRHRFAHFRDQGLRAIPVEVDANIPMEALQRLKEFTAPSEAPVPETPVSPRPARRRTGTAPRAEQRTPSRGRRTNPRRQLLSAIFEEAPTGQMMSVADLRDKFPDMNREEFDGAIWSLVRDGKAAVYPWGGGGPGVTPPPASVQAKWLKAGGRQYHTVGLRVENLTDADFAEPDIQHGTAPGLLEAEESLDVPEIQAGQQATTVQPRSGRPQATAPFASQPPETREGRALFKRLQQDAASKKPKRIGPRSIVEYLNRLVHTRLFVGKTQTTKKHPAHFKRTEHIVRSRSGEWQVNLHEGGHALSAYMKHRKPGWYRQMSSRLIALTQMQGSMASAKSAEEGMAELVRRYIVDHGSLPQDLVLQFESVMDGLAPEVLAGLRDAHRAYQFQRSRPILEQMEAIQNDKPPKPTQTEAIRNVVYEMLFHVVGGGPVLHRIRRRALSKLAGQGPLTKYDPTGLIGLGREAIDGVYRSQQKLAREFLDQVEDTEADFESAYQSTLHVPQEVQRALYGVRKGREGVRVRATGEGFSSLGNRALAYLKDAGFELPTEDVRHGNWIYLSDKSLSAIKHAVGLENWSAFQMYGQYRAALERYRKAGHDYPGRLDGLTPAKLESWLREQEREHPKWDGHFREINRYMDQLLLVSVLSGEMDVIKAMDIKQAWEDYWPLPRQVEDRGPGRRSGTGAEPTAGIRRAFGSPLPFRSLDEAIEVRTKMALEAYYTNRMMLAVRKFGERLDKLKGAPFDARKETLQLMLPLRLEVQKVATLTPEEEARILAEHMNQMLADSQGVPVSALDSEEVIRPEDIVISHPGRPLWRMRKPRAVHIVAPFVDGQRQYFQVTDPLLFDLFSQGKDPQGYLGWVMRFVGNPLRPWRRAITQNLAFAATNFLSRDPSTAGFMGREAASLVPYFHAGLGLLNRLKGTNLDAVSESELLSKALDHTTRDAHRSIVDSFFDMLGEGILIPGYSEMGLSDRIAEAPGQVMSFLMKPLDVANWITGGRALSQLGEQLPREGAYLEALRNGYSEERAQVEYDQITGNFGQKSGNPAVASLVRTAGFLNPALQILWGQTQRITDPDPAARAFYLGMKLPAIAVWGGIAAALNYLMIHWMYDDDEREEVLERMRERRDDDRLSTMAVGGKIRLPFDYGIIGSMASFGWNSVEEMLLADKISGKKKAEELLGRARDLPTPTDALHPFFKTGAEVWLNHSFFFDDEIVPAWMEAAYPYNPELQTYPDTAEVYKKLGSGLKVSPIKVEYAVRQLFTRQLSDAIGLLDKYQQGREIEPRDVPIASRLLQDEPRSWRSQSVLSLSEMNREWEALDGRLEELAAQPGNARQVYELKTQRAELAEAHDMWLDVEDTWQQVKEMRDRPDADPEAVKELEREMTRKARRFLKWQKEGGEQPIPERREADIYRRARVLSRERPKFSGRLRDREAVEQKRAEWQQDIDEALEWLRDRRIAPEDVLDAFRSQYEGLKGRAEYGQNMGRLRRQLQALTP